MTVRDRLAVWSEAVRDRLATWWVEAVLDRIDHLRESWQVLRERVGACWGEAVLDRWDRGMERLASRRPRAPDDVRRLSLSAASPRLAVPVVLAAALCGTALAVVLSPGRVGGSARSAPAASAPDPLLQRLPTVTKRLAAGRALQRTHLADARTARSQADAAAALSVTYRHAASALEPAGRRGYAVVHALRVAAAAYAALERASSTGARRQFSSARERIQAAEIHLRRALHDVEPGST